MTIRINLTDANLEAALKKPECSMEGRSKPLYIWDTSLKGFGIRINRGGQRSFVFKTRIGKKNAWYSIGDAASTTCKDARATAKIYDGKKAEGIAPTPRRAKVVLWEQLVEEFAQKHLATVKPKTRETYASVIKRHIRPAFAKRTIQEITEEDISAFHESLATKSRTANVCLMLLRLMFERAEGWGYRAINTNPVSVAKKAGLKPYYEPERDRQFTDDELQRIGSALEQMESKGSNQFGDIVRVLMLSGARLREVLGLSWEQINEEARTIRWKESKTGKISKPLNDALFAVIAEIPRLENTPWLFPSLGNRPSKSGHIEDIKRPWAQLLKLAEIENATRHDLRHLHGSTAAEIGLNMQTVAALLSHRRTATTERYSKVGLDPRLAASNQVTASLTSKLKGEK